MSSPGGEDSAKPSLFFQVVDAGDRFRPVVKQRGTIAGVIATILLPLIAIAILAIIIALDFTKPEYIDTYTAEDLETVQKAETKVATMLFTCEYGPDSCILIPIANSITGVIPCGLQSAYIPSGTEQSGLYKASICYFRNRFGDVGHTNYLFVQKRAVGIDTFPNITMLTKLYPAYSNVPTGQQDLTGTIMAHHGGAVDGIGVVSYATLQWTDVEFLNGTVKTSLYPTLNPYFRMMLNNPNLSPEVRDKLQSFGCYNFDSNCYGSLIALNPTRQIFKKVRARLTVPEIISHFGGAISITTTVLGLLMLVIRPLEMFLPFYKTTPPKPM